MAVYDALLQNTQWSVSTVQKLHAQMASAITSRYPGPEQAAALARLRASGASSAYLEATLTAEGFYAYHGFQKIGEGTFSRGNSPVSIEIIKMERPL